MDTFLIILACIGEFFICAFAWIGIKLTYKAWRYAAELQLAEYKWRKDKELREKQNAEDKA